MQFSPKSPKGRPWLPGPPPPRRRVPISKVLCAYEADGLTDLNIPIRRIELRQAPIRDDPQVKSYTEPICALAENGTVKAQSKFLFHGCSHDQDPDLLPSFSKIGPSLGFSRPRSYFSRHPAVYWTDSLEFAIAWCIFTETGTWSLSQKHVSDSAFLECVIYVARVNEATLSGGQSSYMIPEPTCLREEQDLVDWCVANMQLPPSSARIPPPGTDISDWAIIGSRIPQHTMASLADAAKKSDAIPSPHTVERTWLYAACDEQSSRKLASAGTEVLHVRLFSMNPASKL